MTLLVNEIFHSIQGESIYSGRPCVFVRLTGCNLRCSYCDTRYAYEEGVAMEIAEIIRRVAAYNCRLVEITGGEPLLQTETPLLILEMLENGYEVIDVGTHTKDSVDYPDIAFSVAQIVAEGKAWRGVIIDGAGIGSCMAANKVPGVRAAMCYDYATAVNSREHNNANVLTLGAGLIGINLAKQILNTWLTTEFGGGRHARRVDKITAIMDRFIKDGKKS